MNKPSESLASVGQNVLSFCLLPHIHNSYLQVLNRVNTYSSFVYSQSQTATNSFSPHNDYYLSLDHANTCQTLAKINHCHKLLIIIDIGSSFNSIAKTTIKKIDLNYKNTINRANAHKYRTTAGISYSLSTVKLHIHNHIIQSTPMIFSVITNPSPTIIGYPQIRSFKPQTII